MEALRTQLDRLHMQFYALKTENRKLQNMQPERAEIMDVEEELRQSQEENVCLTQWISNHT